MRDDQHDDEPDTLIVRGKPMPRVRFGEERAKDESPCPSCGAYYFAFHAVGCDREECPACGGQLATCGCA